MALPTRAITIESLGLDAEKVRPIQAVELIGAAEPVRWEQGRDVLMIQKPGRFPSENVIAFKITFR
jgi:hypothetical protein